MRAYRHASTALSTTVRRLAARERSYGACPNFRNLFPESGNGLQMFALGLRWRRYRVDGGAADGRTAGSRTKLNP
jgi:hypothetical protein